MSKYIGTCVIPPPKCNAFKEVEARGAKKFRMNYLRGNLPVSLEAKGGKVSWKVCYLLLFCIDEYL